MELDGGLCVSAMALFCHPCPYYSHVSPLPRSTGEERDREKVALDNYHLSLTLSSNFSLAHSLSLSPNLAELRKDAKLSRLQTTRTEALHEIRFLYVQVEVPTSMSCLNQSTRESVNGHSPSPPNSGKILNFDTRRSQGIRFGFA